MESHLFFTTFDDIVSLASQEGPRTNIYLPKTQACEQMQHLKEAIQRAFRAEADDSRDVGSISQLVRCLVFIGSTKIEVEDDSGLHDLQKAHALLPCICQGEPLPSSVEDEHLPMTPMDKIIKDIQASECHIAIPYLGVVNYVQVHNALGLYLSQVRVNDARVVLEASERVYRQWAEWFGSLEMTCCMADVPVGDDGRLNNDGAPSERRDLIRVRFDMDRAFTTTVFFLAQVCTALHDTAAASRYCRETLYYQLMSKQEFSKKTWATNALQLSSFYVGCAEYGKALHCLRAGEYMMPEAQGTGRGADNDETAGLVAWSFARYYLLRLQHFGQRYQSEACKPLTVENCNEVIGGWVNFPLPIPPATPCDPIATYDEARDTFKSGTSFINIALQFLPFESNCTQHVELLNDQTRLYSALSVFEPDLLRQIAMVQRQIALLKHLPDELNFNAYPILVRQLVHDLGKLYEDLIRLRHEQRQKGNSDIGQPLSDKAMNALVDRAVEYATRFCESWRNPTTKEMPTTIEEESRVAFFHVVMSNAHLLMKRHSSTPRDEYEAIGRAAERFGDAVSFAEANPFPPDTRDAMMQEVALAKDLINLLRGKQRDLYVAYQRSQPL